MKTILLPFLVATLLAASCSTTPSTTSGSKTSTKTFNGGELIYTDSFTEKQANNLGAFLIESGFYDGKPVSVQLDKQNSIIHLALYIKDNYINSADYQKLCREFIAEIEKTVFVGSAVAMDLCDEQMNVKKTIMAASEDVADVTPVSQMDPETVETIGPIDRLYGYWVCTNITGGDITGTGKELQDLEVLKSNFTFTFDDGPTFGSQFVNQADVENPIEITGSYTLTGNKISFHDLTIKGEQTTQQMKFGIYLTGDHLQLISKEPGKKDLVMTFERSE